MLSPCLPNYLRRQLDVICDTGKVCDPIDGLCKGDNSCENDLDCDDEDEDVHPGADELCDGLDNDCDGVTPASEIDNDGDGMTECDGDCDDTDNTIYPGAPELCDGVDNDCDGDTDEGVTDTFFADMDGERIGSYDFRDAYVRDLTNIIDVDAIARAGIRIGADPLGGASVEYWALIAEVGPTK